MGGIVVHLRKRARIELARNDGLGELTDVPTLLPGQTGAAQGRLVESGYGLWRHGAGDTLEPSVRRPARRERHLLLEDDLHEGLEPWRPIPERRRPEPFDDGRQVLVAARELGHAVPERLPRERYRHLSQTRGPTFL
jgi:hypothetical protein